MKKILLFIIGGSFSVISLANNITVSSAGISGQNTGTHTEIISFNVSWENSWRTSTNESNYDGAWIFVKYRKMGTTDWRHCTINAAGFTPAAGAAITVPADGKGAFIYRAGNGTGNVSWAANQIIWNYGVDGLLDNETVEIRVFGLEMVYIPTGSFMLGSGGTEPSAFFTAPTSSIPYLVSSAGAITAGSAAGNLSAPANLLSGTIPATFPNGYNAFWIMKYEATQQQYADFLNHIDAARASVNNTPVGLAFTGTHPNLTPIAPEHAISSVGMQRAAAFADWSALRPISEMEYEKACRGYNTPAVPNEYAWGNTTLNFLATVTGSGTSSEAVNTPANANTNLGGFNAIVRTGIFARPSGSDRTLSGGTYYGVMNMSDNVSEISIYAGSASGRAISSTVNGDGYLGAGGDSDIPEWTDYHAYGVRGGAYNSGQNNGRVSDRSGANFFTGTYNGDAVVPGPGLRLVRTAP